MEKEEGRVGKKVEEGETKDAEPAKEPRQLAFALSIDEMVRRVFCFLPLPLHRAQLVLTRSPLFTGIALPPPPSRTNGVATQGRLRSEGGGIRKAQ